MKIIGYTAGVFDMFHIGHLNLLRRAKEQCDYLIVAVSSDELVKKYKDKLPIIPFEDRKKIVEAIRYVDEVVVQENRDKCAAYDKYHFDKMFVGDDWKDDPKFRKVDEYMKSKGNKGVIYLSYTKGISSSILRDKIEKKET